MTPTSLRNLKSSRQRLGRIGAVALSLAIVLALTVVATPVTQAQTFRVIHTFTGGADGSTPFTGLTIDVSGNFYGTTYRGGSAGYGIVFRLKRYGSGWLLKPLHTFTGDADGAGPEGRAAIGLDGTLYGTTSDGGGIGYGYGTVFQLRPSPTAPTSSLAPWAESVLHGFDRHDGGGAQGDLTFDQEGNIYGTTTYGEVLGTIYELMPSSSGWIEKILYSGGSSGAYPYGGVVFDGSGNLYGVYGILGAYGCGAVYELSPGSPAWTQQILYNFTGGSDGCNPEGGLIAGPSGNLYGTTSGGGSGGGSVFELTPSSGGWIFNTLDSSAGSYDKLARDSAGNLYGTNYGGGAYGFGSIFELTPSQSGWVFTLLHNFTGGSDGGGPFSTVVFDANGNLYGTTSMGGIGCQPYGCGVVWEITP